MVAAASKPGKSKARKGRSKEQKHLKRLQRAAKSRKHGQLAKLLQDQLGNAKDWHWAQRLGYPYGEPGKAKFFMKAQTGGRWMLAPSGRDLLTTLREQSKALTHDKTLKVVSSLDWPGGEPLRVRVWCVCVFSCRVPARP